LDSTGNSSYEFEHAKKEILHSLYRSKVRPCDLECLVSEVTVAHRKAVLLLVKEDKITKSPEGTIDLL
jgi:hypothetical protein